MGCGGGAWPPRRLARRCGAEGGGAGSSDATRSGGTTHQRAGLGAGLGLPPGMGGASSVGAALRRGARRSAGGGTAHQRAGGFVVGCHACRCGGTAGLAPAGLQFRSAPEPHQVSGQRPRAAARPSADLPRHHLRSSGRSPRRWHRWWPGVAALLRAGLTAGCCLGAPARQ